MPPIFRQQLFCPPLNPGDCRRNEGNADKQHNGAFDVDKAQHGKKSERSQHGIKKLRQICAEICFKLINALHRNLYYFRGADLFVIAGAEL